MGLVCICRQRQINYYYENVIFEDNKDKVKDKDKVNGKGKDKGKDKVKDSVIYYDD